MFGLAEVGLGVGGVGSGGVLEVVVVVVLVVVGGTPILFGLAKARLKLCQSDH